MYLATGDFERGLGSWRPLNLASSVSAIVVNDRSSAKQGSAFMRFRTAVPTGSVAHDTVIPNAILDERNGVQRLCYGLSLSAWLRSFGAGPANGTLAVWDLAAELVNYTEFNVGPTWTEVKVGMDSPGSRIRAEVYLNTIEQWLDVDGVALV